MARLTAADARGIAKAMRNCVAIWLVLVFATVFALWAAASGRWPVVPMVAVVLVVFARLTRALTFTLCEPLSVDESC